MSRNTSRSRVPAGPSQADRRITLGAALFRVGMLIFVAATFWAVTHQSEIAKAFASGGAAAALIGVAFALIGRRQGGRVVRRTR